MLADLRVCTHTLTACTHPRMHARTTHQPTSARTHTTHAHAQTHAHAHAHTVPGARRHVATQRSVNVQMAARTRPSQGRSGGARASRNAAAWTHILVIHGAHRKLLSAAGMVPRRPAPASTIEQPLLGDVHCSEQLHVRVPFAHILLLPSHSNDTLSAIPSKSARCACIHLACVRVGVECSSEHSKGPSTRRDHIDRALTRSSKHA